MTISGVTGGIGASLNATNPDFIDRLGLLSSTPSYDLTVPEPIPNTEGMSPGMVYDLLSGYVEEYGSQEAKQALDDEVPFILQLFNPVGELIGHGFLDPARNVGVILPIVGNPTTSGPAGSSDPSMYA